MRQLKALNRETMITLSDVADSLHISISCVMYWVKRVEELHTMVFKVTTKSKIRPTCSYYKYAINKDDQDTFIEKFNNVRGKHKKIKEFSVKWTPSALDCLRANLMCSECSNYDIVCKQIHRTTGRYPMKEVVLDLMRYGDPLADERDVGKCVID